MGIRGSLFQKYYIKIKRKLHLDGMYSDIVKASLAQTLCLDECKKSDNEYNKQIAKEIQLNIP